MERNKTIKNGIHFRCDKRALLPHGWGKSVTNVGKMFANKIQGNLKRS
jgi:hypothetical protein